MEDISEITRKVFADAYQSVVGAPYGGIDPVLGIWARIHGSLVGLQKEPPVFTSLDFWKGISPSGNGHCLIATDEVEFYSLPASLLLREPVPLTKGGYALDNGDMVAVFPEDELVGFRNHNEYFGALRFDEIEKDWRVVGFPSSELRRVEDRFFHDVTKRGAWVFVEFFNGRNHEVLASYDAAEITLKNKTGLGALAALHRLSIDIPSGVRVWDDVHGNRHLQWTATNVGAMSDICLDGDVVSKTAAQMCEDWVRAAFGDEVFEACRVHVSLVESKDTVHQRSTPFPFGSDKKWPWPTR